MDIIEEYSKIRPGVFTKVHSQLFGDIIEFKVNGVTYLTKREEKIQEFHILDESIFTPRKKEKSVPVQKEESSITSFGEMLNDAFKRRKTSSFK